MATSHRRTNTLTTNSINGGGGNSAAEAKALAEWNSKRWVWVPDEQEGYLAAWIVREEGDMAMLSLESGETLERPVSELEKVNPPTYEGSDDIANLTYLNEPSVVHSLKLRYKKQKIYTYSGLFLVAVNPYQSLPIYTPETVERFKNRKREDNEPHVFAVAEKAWQNMLEHGSQSQSVLVTGESGAGKTENTKKVIQYLAAIAADPLPSSSSSTNFDLFKLQGSEGRNKKVKEGKKLNQLELQILQANPILEAFGNAQTVRNNNSSRFGKFVRIFFNPIGAIAGANIDWYLLEKSRVTSRSEKERGFHVFFQLLRGGDEALKKKLLLSGGPEAYRYLNEGKMDIDGVDDREEFRLLKAALDTVGFTTDEQLSLFKPLAAILLLGNLTVLGTDTAYISDPSSLEKICHLLSIPDPSHLQNALLRPKVKAGTEWVVQSRTRDQVLNELDSLSKILYEKNFGEMVERINKALGRPVTKMFIGVLDIAGFEIFETNGFEQLCINLTNERLQQFFNHHMFVLEQEEYSREKIAWDFQNFGLELQPTIELIESNNPMGILSALDDACLLPRASDKSFTAKMDQLAKDAPSSSQYSKYTPSRFQQGFTVSHYAGQVEYRTDGWLNKNRDPLNDNITALLAKSTDPYVRKLFADYADGESPTSTDGPRMRVRRGAFRTVGQRHKDQLANLMSQLNTTQPHFIRCIVPNSQKAPGMIDTPLVLDQLRCNGVLEGIRIARLGFPNRITFAECRRRFGLLAPNAVPDTFVDGGEACGKILGALGLDKHSYQIGLTKVFFKSGYLAELEERKEEVLGGIFTKIQAACRKHVARRAANKILNRAAAVRTIQRNARIYGELRAWPWWPLFQRVRPLLAAARSADEERRKDAEHAAIREAAERDAAEKAKLQQQQIELERLQQQLTADLESERARMAEKEIAVARSQAREAELERDLATANEDIAQMESQIDRAMALKRAADEHAATLNDALSNTNRLVQTLQTEKQRREADLASQTSIQTSEWERLKMEKEDDRVALENATNRVADQKRELDRLSSALVALETRVTTESQSAMEARSKLKAIEGDLRSAKDEASTLSAKKRDLEASFAAKQAELARASSDQVSVARERDAAVSRTRDLEGRLASLTQDLAAVNRELTASKSSQSAALSDLNTLKKTLEEKTSDSQKQAELGRVREAELKTLATNLSVTTADLATLRREAASEAAQLRRQLEDAKTLLSASDSTCSQLQRDLSSANSRLETLQNATDHLEAKIQAHDLEMAMVRNETAESMLKERNQHDKEMAAVKARYQVLEDDSVKAERLQRQAELQVRQLELALQSERANVATRTEEIQELNAKLEQHVSVILDYEKLNHEQTQNLKQVKRELEIAENKGGKTIVEHIRVLEETMRLQNIDMDRIKAEEAARIAHVRTLESARRTLTQTVEDLQHEKESERRRTFTSKPARDTTGDRALADLESEKKLRQEAEGNVVRLRTEVQQQALALAAAQDEIRQLKRANSQIEQELQTIAASDHNETATLPKDRWVGGTRGANSVTSSPSNQRGFGIGSMAAKNAATPPAQQSPRRRNYE